MEKRFYSNGKLLVSAEYVVLDGVKALALPTVGGQDLVVKLLEEPIVHWTGYDVDGTVWLDETLSLDEVTAPTKGVDSLLSEIQNPFRTTLLSVLQTAHKLNPELLNSTTGFRVETHLSFPRLWGLGTSSTWINNVAQWFEVDAFELLERSFGGSGYDIACAQHNTPITYRKTLIKPEIVSVDFNPPFAAHLFFVYLNQKQSSKEAIQKYREKRNHLTDVFCSIEKLTDELLLCSNLIHFQELLLQHEAHLKIILECETVQERLFPDFPGVIKSLGAWGGDFVLVASENNPTSYFVAKGYATVIPYSKMILSY